MNEAMKQAWLEITEMLGEPTREELDVFLRAWQRAMQAEREECAKVCEAADDGTPYNLTQDCAAAIRARGQA
jgi:hypothetical protein